MPYWLEGESDICCMCFSIETGCKIIAVLSMIHSAGHFMMYSFWISYYETLIRECSETPKDDAEIIYNKYICDKWYIQSTWLVRSLSAFACMLYICGFITSAMVMRGITKKSAKLLTPWFYYVVVIIAFSFISFFVFNNVGATLRNLVFDLILGYFMWIVNKHKHNLTYGTGNICESNQMGEMGGTALQEVCPPSDPIP